ncbi:MAG: hypothetical protein LBI34_01440 [Puniceicoccales bacterium]|nr:hypothetical protein [Puniceicoccales bacterium]
MTTKVQIINVNATDFSKLSGASDADGAAAARPCALLTGEGLLCIVRCDPLSTVSELPVGLERISVTDPRFSLMEWLIGNSFSESAISRAMGITDGNIIFYGEDGNTISASEAAKNPKKVTHVCIANSNDGKSSVFAVTNMRAFRRVVRKRGDGAKVTYSFMLPNSSEISSSEIPPQDDTWRQFLQTISRCFLTTGVGAVVTLLSILISAFLMGNPFSPAAAIASGITFLIFTAMGLAIYAMV